MTRFPRLAAPIRLVLFDAFDTLVTPRPAPHLQYAAVAREYGLNVCDNDVKSAFKQAFRTTSIEHPNYGLESDIASPDEWWKLVIQRTFSPHLHSRVSSQQYLDSIDSLSHRLVTRFGTSEAYHLFDDVVPTLRRLSQTQTGDGRPLQLALATNSDSRILSVLKSFGLDQFLELDVASWQTKTTGPTLSYFEKCAKPDSRFFHAAVRRASFSATVGTLNAANVLYVGDQLHEDFWGATNAGLQAAWLQRPTTSESNQPYQHIGNHRNTENDEAYVRDRTIPSLECLVDIVTCTD
ncbi:uncharacterized protein UTRI_02026_B [Ustilago trichophora]|uniref:Hydrolase (HAD superfamily) n=1 Tax=Ustilago trichophora TaxID=86804 RepID=A0A5C3DXN3_9BASI|nr:uncharacterized protein UTRI_02026_B [Ustilago trichophora]